jgi:lantibiotic modifying enzyme
VAGVFCLGLSAAQEFRIRLTFLRAISDQEFIAIIIAAASHDDSYRISTNGCREGFSRQRGLPPWASELRRVFDDLAEIKFTTQQTSPLQKLCEAGSEYGLKTLEKRASSELLSLLRPRSKRRIKDHLRQILARATRPCLTLELKAFHCAYEAIYSQKDFSTPEVEQKFLGQRPSDRLISLFKRFPVLAELWCRLIHQWCESISELLARVDADKQTLSRAFFRGQLLGEIVDLRAGLSDPHNHGRTVTRLRFETGEIIYKPRSGCGENEWFKLVTYLNGASFRPKLTAAQVLCRDGYCWMQEVKFKPCKDQANARRFYERLGGTIAAAYLLKAVDCHRDNVIASGEHPVLVDAEALWHARDEKNNNLLDAVYETGFLPSSGKRSSYQYRSSVLGQTRPGRHTPHVTTKPLTARYYEREILTGFRAAWRSLVGTTELRASFARNLQRLRGQHWRRIYRSTAEYDAIIRASIQPAAMRTGADRHAIIANLCRGRETAEPVISKEIEALKRLDIPYFSRRSTGTSILPKDNVAPAELINALRRALQF